MKSIADSSNAEDRGGAILLRRSMRISRFSANLSVLLHPALSITTGARIAVSMTRETKNGLLEGTFECLEWLGEFETMFVYLVVPVLCVVGLYILGTAFYQFVVDTHPATASAASDFLSIDPDKWLPRV